jgi:hypothetical protein
MPYAAKFLIAVLAAGSAADCGRAQDEPMINPGGVSMKAVQVLGQSGVGVKVIGGQPAKTADWPASFFPMLGSFHCTATLIGPKALLLAAHCVGDGQEASIEVGGSTLSGPCTHASGYRNGDKTADYALCRMNQGASDIRFETVNLDAGRIKRGKPLLLTGYGCTVPGGASDGVFRTAKANVTVLAGEAAGEPNWIRTQDEYGICNGDSGGGSYLMLGEKRLIAVVNSRTKFIEHLSYLSSLSSPDGRGFLTEWIDKNGGEKICGLNLSGDLCQ